MRLAYLLALSAMVSGTHLRGGDDTVSSIQHLRGQGNQTFAVLVAGSSSYANYRHQADVCHAYQLLSANGVPDENIVVMMYDDIAASPDNPRKGELVNRPDGDDVYGGVPKDYVGRDVTATNFLKILRGESMDGVGSGKTLRSGDGDYVFIYYSDHGASGLVAMPSGGYLYASDLNQALEDMHYKGRFKQLVFYLEACESGSMFVDLKPDLNIYATTAASPYESSYACYFDSVLGNCYSVNWLEDSDVSDLRRETLEDQYVKVKDETTESQVMQYGQMGIDSESLSNFQAEPSSTKRKRRDPYPPVERSPMDSRDVRLKYLTTKVAAASTSNELQKWTQQLTEEIRSREQADQIFAMVNDEMAGLVPDDQVLVPADCLRTVVEGTEAACGSFNDYSLKYVSYLHDACRRRIQPTTTLSIVQGICASTTTTSANNSSIATSLP